MTHQQLQTIDADTLLSTTLPPTRFIIDRLLPQGLHILAGAPKVGKSWLALWLCLQVAQGTSVWDFPTHRGTVLYLCLEDSVLRIQNRLFEITEDAPDSVHFCTECAHIGQGLEEQVDAFVAAHPDTAQEYAEQCFAAAGVTGRPARRMASAALAMRDEQDITLRAAMTQVYCARLCYVLVTSVGFLLILLILAAIGNLPNLAFQLPNREKLNDIGGAAFGAVNGVCFGILLCWALQFAGPVIGRDTLAHTALAKALQAIDVLTLGVGV